MKATKESIKLFKFNCAPIIMFQIVYKLATAALVTPIFYYLLNLSVKAAGIKYLVSENFVSYFKAPSTYVIFLFMLAIYAMFILVNISGLIYAIEASKRGERTNTLALIVKGIGNALRVFNPKNYILVIYVLFILPFTYSTMISGSLLLNRIPDFVTNFVKQNKLLLIGLILLYLFLCVFAMLRIFALNYFSMYKMSYSKAVKLSGNVVRKNKLKVFLGVIIWNIFFVGLMFLFGGVVSVIFASVTKKVIAWKKARFIINSAFEIIFMCIYLVLNIISTPLIYSYICTCFYDVNCDDFYEEFAEVKRKRRKHKEISEAKIKKKNKLSIVALIIICVLVDGLYIFSAVKGWTDLHILYPTRADITAHRGDSANAPENTMAAFELALENGADVIEIDVRQTKDGRYIVMHDESLFRTTGDNHKVGAVDYEYISKLDAGSRFSEDFAGERIPTLEEVIEFAIKNDITLNIEMKTAHTDNKYIEGIVEILHKYDYVSGCMVASTKYRELVELKELDKKINTLLVMHYAFNNFGSMECVDAFSIRYNYVNKDIVRDIHRHNKKVYAWTVDNEEEIKWLLLRDVDGIITNNPYNTKEIVYKANNSIVVDILSRICEMGW